MIAGGVMPTDDFSTDNHETRMKNTTFSVISKSDTQTSEVLTDEVSQDHAKS